MLETLQWLGHVSFRIDGPPVVYIDPFRIGKGLPAADLLLITHEHSDHLSPDDIAKVCHPTTKIIGPDEVAARLPDVEPIAAGELKTFSGVHVRAVPAYHVNKQFHPKATGKLGYLITIGGVTYYHAGDTDLIPEMAGLAPDVALLPVSGTYVMTADEAADAARRIRPRVAVPMHYGSIIGSAADAQRFAALLEGSGIEVVILERE